MPCVTGYTLYVFANVPVWKPVFKINNLFYKIIYVYLPFHAELVISLYEHYATRTVLMHVYTRSSGKITQHILVKNFKQSSIASAIYYSRYY